MPNASEETTEKASSSTVKRFILDRRARRMADEIRDGGAADDVIATKVLANLTESSVQFWEIARWRKDGPQFVRIGGLVGYRRSDVVAWLEARAALHEKRNPAQPATVVTVLR